jgi:prepilin-type N-terminal cleavage/methylation domain-containing protein
MCGLEVLSMNTRTKPNRGGFTLVEMLVVIAIIGVLAAILIPTLYLVVIKARQNSIAQEVGLLAQHVEAYKQEFKDYPPDFSSVTSLADLANPRNLVVLHLRKAFPRHQENLQTFFVDNNGNLSVPDRDEALVFWLSRLKNDPRRPLTGPGEVKKMFEFDEDRLRDPDNDGWYSYVPQDGEDAPYVYFDSRTYATAQYRPGGPSTTLILLPYKTKINATASLSWANPTTFQIISAGLDGEFGKYNTTLPDPHKDFSDITTWDIKNGDMDNQSNFSDGKIFEDHVE